MMLRRILWTLLLLLGPISLAQAGGCHTVISDPLVPKPHLEVPLADEARAELHIAQATEQQSSVATEECKACDLACLQSCASACALALETALCAPDTVAQEFAVLSKPSRPSHTLPLLRPPTQTF